MNKALVAIGVFGLFTLLPIWRGAGHSRHDGVNLFRLIRDSTHLTPDSPFGHPHILYEEAVEQARQTYWELYKEKCG